VTAEVNLKDYNRYNLDVYKAITNKGPVIQIFHAVLDASKAQGTFFRKRWCRCLYIEKFAKGR